MTPRNLYNLLSAINNQLFQDESDSYYDDEIANVRIHLTRAIKETIEWEKVEEDLEDD